MVDLLISPGMRSFAHRAVRGINGACAYALARFLDHDQLFTAVPGLALRGARTASHIARGDSLLFFSTRHTRFLLSHASIP